MAKDLETIKNTFQSGDYVNFPLNSIMLEWPHLAEPDTHFDSVGKYHVNCILSEAQAKDMEFIGFNVKTNTEGQKYVDAKRKPILGPPRVIQDGEPFDAAAIGNGTVATVKCSTKYMKVTGKYYLPIYLEEVAIEDLVVYEGEGKDVDGF